MHMRLVMMMMMLMMMMTIRMTMTTTIMVMMMVSIYVTKVIFIYGDGRAEVTCMSMSPRVPRSPQMDVF